MAWALYAEKNKSIFFNALDLCSGHYTGEERMLRTNPPQEDTSGSISNPVSQKEFVKLYPNPAKDLINLSFYAETNGVVNFELLDQLGQPVIKQNLSNSQAFTQFATKNVSSGLYYWSLKDSQRTIKTGIVAIVR